MKATSERRKGVWWEAALGLAIALAFLVLALHRIEAPGHPVFDEVYQGAPGTEIAALGRFEGNVSHPPLVKEAIALSLLVAGAPVDPEIRRRAADSYGKLPDAVTRAWRLPSALAAAVAVALMFGLARDLTGSAVAAAAAATLLALDGCFFIHARIAMTNDYEVMFVLAAAWCAWRAVASGRDRWLVPAALAIGGAMACRWSSLAPCVLLAAWLAWHRRGSAGGLVRLVAAWAVFPALAYLGSYAPLLAAHGALWSADAWWNEVFVMQIEMLAVHANPTYVHASASPWWSWPLMARPVWYDRVYDPPMATVLWAIGNAAVWWGTVPALLAAAWAGWRGHRACGLVAVLGLGTWLAWGVQPRSLLYMHYFLAVIPFGCLALAMLGEAWWRGRSLSGAPSYLERPAARAAVCLFGLAAVAWFVHYYPVLTATPIPIPELHRRVWFGSAWL